MNAFDQLGLITEVAATLLGFVAVFLVLSNRDGKFDASDRHFVQAMVLSSVSCILSGLWPSAVSLFGVFDVWFISLWFFVSLGTVVCSIMISTQLKMSEEEKAKLHFVWHLPSWTLASLGILMSVLGLMFPQFASAYYVAASSMILAVAIWCFIAVVFRRFF